MDWKDVGSKILDSAPMIGTLLGGPLGGGLGGLVKMIGGALGLSPEETKPDKVMQIIEQDPQALLKFKELEMTHEVDLQKLVLQQEQMHLQDRQNARAREVKITEATGRRDVNLYIIAWIVIVGFFALCGVLMKWSLPQGQNEVVYMLFGALASGFGAVIQYFFGSSKSSSEKTKLLAGGK